MPTAPESTLSLPAPRPPPRPRFPRRQHSRNAGAALLTRVELGWGCQGPGGGQGGLGAQRAGQEGGRATWEGRGQTDASELIRHGRVQAVFMHARCTCRNTLLSEDTRTDRRTHGWASGVTLGVGSGEGSSGARCLAEAGKGRKHARGLSLPEPRQQAGSVCEAPLTQQAKQTFPCGGPVTMTVMVSNDR